MPFPTETLVLAPLIVLGAYVIFGITGFGSTIIAVPLLAYLVPIKFAIPMFVLLDFAAALRHGFQFHATIARRELAWLVPSMIAGIGAGVALFVHLPGVVLLGALGVFVLGYGLYMLHGREPSLRLRRGWAVPVGLFGGCLSAMFGAAGPIFVAYLTSRGLDATRIRSTMSMIFIITTATRITLFFLSGVFAQDHLFAAAAALAIPMLIGLRVGHRLHVTLPRAQLLRIMGALLALSGGSLVIRAFG